MRMAGWSCPGRQIQRNEMTNEGEILHNISLTFLSCLMAIVGQILENGKVGRRFCPYSSSTLDRSELGVFFRG
jgi:hypothetical protein